MLVIAIPALGVPPMKVRLAAAFAVLLFASVLRADTLIVGYNPVTIPDGSTITSELAFFDPLYGFPTSYVGYTFADGTGFSEAEVTEFGSWGTLDFSTPLISITFDWFGGPFYAVDNEGEAFDYGSNDSGSGTETFSGTGITQITWQSNSAAGIESMSYTLDGPTPAPEPSSLLLLGIGLAGLIGLVRRNRFVRLRTSNDVFAEPENDTSLAACIERLLA
jgi:hypothetical protein